MNAEASDSQRKTPRRFAFAKGTIRVLGCPAEPLLVINLSENGFMGIVKGEYRPGCFVEVDIPGEGVLKARLAWTKRGRLGGMFLKNRSLESAA